MPEHSRNRDILHRETYPAPQEDTAEAGFAPRERKRDEKRSNVSTSPTAALLRVRGHDRTAQTTAQTSEASGKTSNQKGILLDE